LEAFFVYFHLFIYLVIIYPAIHIARWRPQPSVSFAFENKKAQMQSLLIESGERREKAGMRAAAVFSRAGLG
jgi:hypothetical protein